MKYCKSCGAELVDEAVVCPKCGVATEEMHTEPKQNTVGIVGLVLCFFAGSVVSFIVSLIGYLQGKKNGEKVSCALVGIILSSIEIVFAIILWGLLIGAAFAGAETVVALALL